MSKREENERSLIEVDGKPRTSLHAATSSAANGCIWMGGNLIKTCRRCKGGKRNLIFFPENGEKAETLPGLKYGMG